MYVNSACMNNELLTVFVAIRFVCVREQSACSQSLLQGDACMCVRVGINACMFVCMCMNKAHVHTVIPAR